MLLFDIVDTSADSTKPLDNSLPSPGDEVAADVEHVDHNEEGVEIMTRRVEMMMVINIPIK